MEEATLDYYLLGLEEVMVEEVVLVLNHHCLIIIDHVI